MMLRVFTAFSGYDSQCMALDRTGIEYDLVGWSEIDDPVIQAHNAVYSQWKDRNFGDICKIDWDAVPDFDLFTYSFPCTQISRMGNETGLDEGSGTESSLLWECRKAIRRKLPKYLLLENVSALLSKKFVGNFCKWQAELEELGYANYTKVLNASDYGIPQNRKRVYMVSILHGNASYYFPRPVPLERVLSDFLDSDVADRYYLKRSTVDGYIENTKKMRMRGNGFRFEMSDLYGIAKTLTTKSGSRMTDNYIDASKMPVSKSNGMISEDRYMRDGGELVRITTIRKLTERECFRLMGVRDTDIDKILSVGIGSVHLYKMIGNSIVVDVLYHIFMKLLVDKKCEYGSISLF